MKKVLYLMVSVIIVLGLFVATVSAATISTLNAGIDNRTKVVTITGTIDSGQGKEVTIKVADPSWDPNTAYISQTTSGIGGAFSFTYTSKSSIEGTYTAEAGGENVDVKRTTTFVYDITPPTVPVITTPAQTLNADSITVTGTAEANSTVRITGGGAAATGTAVGGNYSITVNLNQDAVNNLSVTATDAYDNTSSAATVAITEDSTGPLAPAVSVSGGTYNAAQSVALTPAGDAVGTFYTLDGSEPTNTSTAYVGAIPVDGAHGATIVLKAVSYDAVGNKGLIRTETYVFDKQGPAAPVANPVGGTYNTAQSVVLTPAGDAIGTYYTLNGNEPNNLSTGYVGAITVDGVHGGTVVLKAVSYDAVSNKGTVMTQTYVFDKQAPVYAAGYPKANVVGVTTAEVLVKSDESGRAFMVCLPDGAAAPSAAQVKAGTNASDAALGVNLKATAVFAANIDSSLIASGLISNTSYDIYIVSEDSVGNKTTVRKIDITTLRKFTVTPSVRVGLTNPATQLQPGQTLEATMTAKNNQTIPQDALLIAALYNPSGTMEYYMYLSKNIAAGATEVLNAGLLLPADITGYRVRIFVWGGTSISTSTMEPLSNVKSVPQ